MEYEYDNSKDLLKFIRDVSETNSKADFNDDKVWKSEFKFLMKEIDKFLNKQTIRRIK